MRALRAIISALGLLVGLSWENTFSASIEELAESCSDPRIVKVGLSSALLIVVYPSWNWYILPKTDKRLASALQSDDLTEEEDEELEKALQSSDEDHAEMVSTPD